MARKVADVMWELLAKAGVKRCYLRHRRVRVEPGNRRAPAQREDRVHPLKETVFAYPTQISSLLWML